MVNAATQKQIANWLVNPDNPGSLPLAEAEKKIKEFGLEKIYREIELPLIEVLEDMKRVGIGLDRKRLAELRKESDTKIKKLEEEIFKLAGEKFNLNSPRQLAAVLFEKLRIKPRSGRIKSGIFSTKAEQLKISRGEHPIIGLVLDYREAFKMESTYLGPLLKLCQEIASPSARDDDTPSVIASRSEAISVDDGEIASPAAGGLAMTDATSPSRAVDEAISRGGECRARATFIQTGTATGRLSSRNPNLQNIPPAVKEVFVADAGYRLAAFDYSQIELRILAALSQDKKMLAAFVEGKDIHALTASQVFNAPIDKVTPEMRRLAKTLNFGVVYGMGPNAFANASGLTAEEARKFIAEYFSDFAEVKKWQERVKSFARENGFAENLNGRKRWLPAINSQSRYLAAEAERMAINMPVQSLGADIIKLAMIKARRRFKDDKDVRLLLSIHDELLFEIKSDKVNEKAKEIKELMENIYQLPGVGLEINVKVGKNWGALEY